MVRPEHKRFNMRILSGFILNVSKGIAGRSNDQNISRIYTIFIGSWHVLNLGFMSFVFVFPPRRDISSFGFSEN